MINFIKRWPSCFKWQQTSCLATKTLGLAVLEVIQMPPPHSAQQGTIKLVGVAGNEKEITQAGTREATRRMRKLLVVVILAPNLQFQGKVRLQRTTENNQLLHLSQKQSLLPNAILR